jgi:hypothetical protein
MALDLANDYSRKDSASASNVYYGYSVDSNVADGDKVFAIRRVNTTSSVETVKWTNGNQFSYVSDWTGRTYSFATPGGSLNLSFTTSIATSGSLITHRLGIFTWSSLQGVSKYLVQAVDSTGRFLQVNGLPLTGQYLNRGYGWELINLTTWTNYFLNSGTYTFTVRAENVAGFTSSTITINFPT